jgi:hypothetical protein
MSFALVENLDSHIEGKYRPIQFEKRVLRNIFGLKREEVTWEPKRLHNEGLRH